MKISANKPHRVDPQVKELLLTALKQPDINLKTLLDAKPPTRKLGNYIRDIRAFCSLDAIKQIKQIPRHKQKMADTTQVSQCKWRTASNKEVPIDLIGFRHGLVQINTNTAKSLDQLLKNVHPSRIFQEQNLGRVLAQRHLPSGTDVKDQSGIKLIKRFPSVLLMLPAMLIARLCVRLGHGAARSLTGPKMRKDFEPDRAKVLQGIGFMREDLEIQAHQLLPEKKAKELDSSFTGILTNERSAYMAGYLAATASNHEQPLVFLCGSAHMPRIESLLKFNAINEMPPTLRKPFEIGFHAAEKRTKKAHLHS